MSYLKSVQGIQASDEADANNNPVKTGGVANTGYPTEVSSGDIVEATYDTLGKVVTSPYSNPTLYTFGYIGLIGVGTATVIAAPGAGKRLLITSVIVANQGAAADYCICASARFRLQAGTTVTATFPVPYQVGVNTAFTFANGGAASSFYVQAIGYIVTN